VRVSVQKKMAAPLDPQLSAVPRHRSLFRDGPPRFRCTSKAKTASAGFLPVPSTTPNQKRYTLCRESCWCTLWHVAQKRKKKGAAARDFGSCA